MKFSLQLKLILLTTALVAATQLATGFFIARHVEATMDKEYHRQMLPLAENLAHVCTNAMIGKDLLTLRNLLRVAMMEKNVAEAMVLDPTGKILMHNRLTEVGKIRSGDRFATALQASEPGVSGHYQNDNGDTMADVFVPVQISGVRLGTILLSCSHKHIATQITDLKFHILIILICGILISILCAILLASYLTKPLQRLIAVVGQISSGSFPDETLRITGNDEIAALTEAFNEMAKKLKKMVYHDPLTGAYNRQMFQQRITQEIAHARRHQQPLALLMIDVDHFKKINDTFGHLAGDRVLQQISDLLRTTVRTDDYVARFGGEEFVVIAPETEPETAMILAERVRATMAAHAFTVDSETTRWLTISIGVANLTASTQTVDDLIRNADNALYAAKENGRNQVCQADG
ncbi:MAG: GGDEF domain-containing protein [Desulfobulbaceae bacterium]|nr:GGDEF domain-containing protein [Desulfobulbaceae bacterium]